MKDDINRPARGVMIFRSFKIVVGVCAMGSPQPRKDNWVAN